MPNIVAVKQNPKKPEQAFVTLDDGRDCWCPSYESVKDLAGKPVPDGWNITEGDYGPRLLPPKEKKGGFGGGAAAFRNTKEGQAIEQERMDRRTALMQAVEHYSDEMPGDPAVLVLADTMYAWLRKTAGASATPAAGANPSLAPAPPSAPTVNQQPLARGSEGPGADTPAGAGPGGKAGTCLHPNRTSFKPPEFNDPLPRGFAYCTSCETTIRES